MYLTLVNMAMKRKIPLFKYRGKYREVKPVELPALREHYESLKRQEQNMLILRHPYLTVEQSKGHMKGLRDPVNHRAIWSKMRNDKFDKVYTCAEQLSHLRSTDRWD